MNVNVVERSAEAVGPGLPSLGAGLITTVEKSKAEEFSTAQCQNTRSWAWRGV